MEAHCARDLDAILSGGYMSKAIRAVDDGGAGVEAHFLAESTGMSFQFSQ